MASPHLPLLSEATDNSDTEDNMEGIKVGDVLQGQTTDKSWEVIGYVVAEVQIRSAPPYTRGSGPPSAPISIMPKHDKLGIILDLTKMDGKPLYIVSYKDKPALRFGVRVAEILDYVSPRTLENWEIEQEAAIEANRKAKAEAKAKAKAQSKAPVRIEPQAKEESRVTTGTAQGRGRPAKRKREDENDSGGISTAGGQLEDKMAGSRKKQASEQTRATQPSLSSPPQPFDPYDSESDFEDENTSIQLERQLLGSASGARAFKLGTQEASSGTSPEPVKAPEIPVPTARTRRTRSSSRQTRSTSATSVKAADTRQSSRTQPRRGSVAMTSSVEFANMYENLENGKKTRKSNLSEIRPSTFYDLTPAKNQKNPANSASAKQHSVQPAKPGATEPAVASVDSDEEYEVDYILSDKYQKDKKGKHVRYYYIKWVGDWPNSWEPETNVGSEVIALYKKKVAEKKRSQSATSSVAGENREPGGTMTMGDSGAENGGASSMSAENGGTEDITENGKEIMNGKEKGTEVKTLETAKTSPYFTEGNDKHLYE